MSLLTKIAISNGNKKRKNQATTLLVKKDARKVAILNKSLQAEVIQRQSATLFQSTNVYIRR